ncbi:MAG TPA: ABC transporter ATP-binding protein [Candidatus Dormibacteraeota bacterium]|nr:ABC transporter ATP-binding protein [Candidatus Dormibacteraeota bacterium]
MKAALRTEGLSKDYGQGRGLFDLDLEVAAGEVFGYLGPNGAGKTTTIRLLMDMIRPTRGRAEVFGVDCQARSVEVKRLVGYLPGELPQFGGLRGREVVSYVAGLRGGVDSRRIKTLAERLDLDLGRRFREYSRGNKQKLGLVLALMHDPRLLILDEPTSGLDPLNQQEFHRMVDEARDRGATVFLSSHVLSEVEQICQRVAIIREGHLVQIAKLDELHHIRYHHVEVDFAGNVPLDAVRAAAGVEQVSVQGQRLTCAVRGSFRPLLAALERAEVLNMVSHEPTLEEIFLAYYRDEPAEVLSEAAEAS